MYVHVAVFCLLSKKSPSCDSFNVSLTIGGRILFSSYSTYYVLYSFSGRLLCVGEESQLHYCRCCHSRVKVVRTCRLFCSHYPSVLFSQSVQGCGSTANPKVASQWQVLACTRRQLARYIVVVVVHQTYDLCVCWRPMPAEPAESQKQRQTLERSFLMQIQLFLAAAFTIWNKKSCSALSVVAAVGRRAQSGFCCIEAQPSGGGERWQCRVQQNRAAAVEKGGSSSSRK